MAGFKELNERMDREIERINSKTYLGINDHKIGPPPNWRDDRFWSKRLLRRKKFNRQRYILEVEEFIKRQHERIWEIICELDEMSGERGNISEQMERLLSQVESEIAVVKARMTIWADRWRLPASEYHSKYMDNNNEEM